MKFKFSGKDALTHWMISSPGRRRCQASYPVPVTGLVNIGSICVFYVYSKGYVYGSLQQCNK